MRIHMNTTAAGPDGVLNADNDYVVNDTLGHALVCGGYAREIVSQIVAPVKPAPVEIEETADAVPVVERAVARGHRGKR